MAKPSRVGKWVETFPFAINNLGFGTGPTESASFSLPATETIAVLSEWKTLGVDPSGWRHRTEHPSFQRILASGAGSQVASLNFESFDVQSTDISRGSGVSQTKVMLFRIDKFTSPNKSRVHNMKIWASDTSDFLEPQTHRVLYKTSTPWTSGFAFTSEDLGDETLHMDSSLPDRQNLFRTGRVGDKNVLGEAFRTITGSGDADVSQWIYIAFAASGTMPLGEYGDIKDGPEGFNLRVTYNVDNLIRFFD